ncbi:MAG: extracellular solute-binding protein [Sphaerochaetaceae bacterium]|nr:extracellular solute-binding protein [Sphaerochaetaceae bacterium]
MKKTTVILMILALACTALFAQAQAEKPAAPAQPVEIVLWHTLTDHHQANLQVLIDGFNASQSAYKVVAEAQPYSEYASKLLQTTRAGNGPDFTTMFPSDAINYKTNGFLYDLTDLVSDPVNGIPDLKEQTADGLYAEITQWGDGRVFMIPVLFGSEVLYYNKTLFDSLGLSAPKTWTELEEASKVIFKATGIPGFGTDSVTDSFQGWCMQAGSSYVDPVTKTVTIDKAIAVEKLEWFAKGIKEGYFRLVGEDYYFSNPFGSQAVASYVGSAAGVDYVYAAIPAEGKEGHFEVACAPIPQEGPKKYISSWGSTYVCLSRDEVHAKGVVAFLKYMTAKDNLIYWAEKFGSTPARKEAINDPAFVSFASSNIALTALIQEYDSIGYLPSIPGAASIRTEIDKMVQSVTLGLSDASTAFDNFVKASNAALSDY